MTDVRKMTIGEKLKAVRVEKNFSQRQLQEKSGVERNFISLVENNHRSPSFKTLMRIADALGVTVGYITDYDKIRQEIEGAKVKPIFADKLENILSEGEAAGVHEHPQFFPAPIINEYSLATKLEQFAETDIEDYVFMSSKWVVPPVNTGRYCCLWVKEETKALPPVIESGALVCLDSYQRNPAELEGEIVVFQDKNGGCTVKRLRSHGDHILGVSDQAMHQPPLIIPSNKSGAVLGKVIWCWNKFSE